MLILGKREKKNCKWNRNTISLYENIKYQLSALLSYLSGMKKYVILAKKIFSQVAFVCKLFQLSV